MDAPLETIPILLKGGALFYQHKNLRIIQNFQGKLNKNRFSIYLAIFCKLENNRLV